MVYRVAVVGAGKIAARHLKAISELRQQMKPVGVADVLEERARGLSDEYGANSYTDYKEMVEREQPHIAVVTLPHFLHMEAAVFCAERGCHVLLEKPMALNPGECDEIIAAARRGKVKLMVGHTQHYSAENRKAKKLIDEGILGRLAMINDVRHVSYFSADRPDWFLHKAMAGGGILTNLGAHSVDKIQWLGGSGIVKVTARVSYPAPLGDIEGAGLVFLENEQGVPATISQSGYGGVSRNETELIFNGGMMKLMSGKGLYISKNGVYEQVPIEPLEQAFVLQFRDLLASIETGAEPECSGEYAKSVVAVTNSIYQSHETGKEVFLNR